MLVWTDKEKLTQILINLLYNALKYTPSGGAVEVQIRDFANYFEISVSHKGIGISKKDLPLIFERFYRTEWK